MVAFFHHPKTRQGWAAGRRKRRLRGFIDCRGRSKRRELPKVRGEEGTCFIRSRSRMEIFSPCDESRKPTCPGLGDN